MWRKKLGSWLNPKKLVKRIKLLQLIGRESRRGLLLKGIKEKDQTIKMKEVQITGMTEDMITGSKKVRQKKTRQKTYPKSSRI